MGSKLQHFLTLGRGVRTVVRRRGPGYLSYLVTGVAWPDLLYRKVWGPGASRKARAAFEAYARATVRPASDADLRAARLLADASVSATTLDMDEAADLAALMDRAHAAGITGVRHAFDLAVRTPQGEICFSAVPDARLHRARDARFLAARDEDREAFNRRFGTTLLTETEARRQLRDLKARVPPGYRDYAPIDFGGGLTIGQVASTDSGTGRWDFFNGRIVGPLVTGKRVLDLGSNNGSLPLMMLRAGAREVVAVEFTPQIADFARLNARILAWRDMRPYRIDVLNGDMRLFLERDLGRFDVVTAFCSLYYLPEEDMARIIEKAAKGGATLILQANDAIHNLPAQTSQLEALMRANGYANVRVHEASGFARPLLVGAPDLISIGAREYELMSH